MFERILTACIAGCLAFAAAAQEPRLADPMRPATRKAGAATSSGERAGPRLAGIIVSATRRLALVDGEFLQEGDSLPGLRIERIERNAVTVRNGSRTFVLRPETAPHEDAVPAGEPQ